MWIAKTHIGKIVLACFLLLVFGSLYNVWEWAKWPMFASVAFLLGYFFVMMYYATKNTIRDIKDWIKRR